MERAGRNEPCPCGSGRKYKKCCLPQESVRARFGALIEASALALLSRLARFAETSANRSLESVAREEFPFWRGRLDKAQGARLVDFLMFELRPKHFGRRTVEQFAIEVASSLDDDVRAMLERWVDAPRHLYRASEWSGGFTTCVDVFDDEAAPIDVFDAEGSWRPARGDAFALRALRVGDLYLCAGPPLGYPGRTASDVADAVRRRHLDFVRTQRIASMSDFLRLAPKALDEESVAQLSSSTIVLPGA
jgi:hypothetical protein